MPAGSWRPGGPAATRYVLADASLARASAQAWAGAALALYHRLAADALVVEVNQGGEMAAAVLAQCDPAVPVTPVHATRGKYLRAEPVSLLYARGLVHHVGAFPALEDELCDFGPDGLSGGGSPDRLDALVWALTHLHAGGPARAADPAASEDRFHRPKIIRRASVGSAPKSVRGLWNELHPVYTISCATLWRIRHGGTSSADIPGGGPL